jgi:hypothetical protein
MAQPSGTGEAPPILLDLGKIRGKVVRQFREGRGPLVDEVRQILAESRKNLGAETATKELVPIVLVYEKKRKRRKRGNFFPLC